MKKIESKKERVIKEIKESRGNNPDQSI